MGVCVEGICLDEFDDLGKMKPQRAASDHGVAPSIVCCLGGSAGERGRRRGAGSSRRRAVAGGDLSPRRYSAGTLPRLATSACWRSGNDGAVCGGVCGGDLFGRV